MMTDTEVRSARACLSSVEVDLTELKEMESWWEHLSSSRQQELKDFLASVVLYLVELKGVGWVEARPL
jgi:hypothetical protein